MKKLNRSIVHYKFMLIFLLASLAVHAQSANDSATKKLYNTIAYLDSSLFSTAYTCNAAKNITFFTEDLEFYHDIGGLTTSRKTFMENLERNFCGDKEFKLRRELVKGSMKVFPLNNYGAVQTGEHLFYQTHKGQKEKLTGIAKFTHIWQLKDGEWRISRVISYDHQPAQ